MIALLQPVLGLHPKADARKCEVWLVNSWCEFGISDRYLRICNGLGGWSFDPKPSVPAWGVGVAHLGRSVRRREWVHGRVGCGMQALGRAAAQADRA